MHFKQKKWQNLKYSIYNNKLTIGTSILLYDTRYKKDMSYKLSFK